MPIVNIKVTREGTSPAQDRVTPDQKAALISGVTQLLKDVLNKSPETTFVIIDEVEFEDWGIAGVPVDVYRRQKATQR